jgi:hypothetical protein
MPRRYLISARPRLSRRHALGEKTPGRAACTLLRPPSGFSLEDTGHLELRLEPEQHEKRVGSMTGDKESVARFRLQFGFRYFV